MVQLAFKFFFIPLALVAIIAIGVLNFILEAWLKNGKR
jgi:hypothetical protein